MNLFDKITCRAKCEEIKNYYAERIIKESIIQLYHAYGNAKNLQALPVSEKIDEKDELIRLDDSGDSMEVKLSKNGKYWIEANGRYYPINSDKIFERTIKNYRKYARFSKNTFWRFFNSIDVVLDSRFFKLEKMLDGVSDSFFRMEVNLDSANSVLDSLLNKLT